MQSRSIPGFKNAAHRIVLKNVEGTAENGKLRSAHKPDAGHGTLTDVRFLGEGGCGEEEKEEEGVFHKVQSSKFNVQSWLRWAEGITNYELRITNFGL
jgi:hypothetical protein